LLGVFYTCMSDIDILGDYGNRESSDYCDICGLSAVGSLNGNDLCESHLNEYRCKHDL
jgi:hypothetical protein